jgi:hypothetical protein
MIHRSGSLSINEDDLMELSLRAEKSWIYQEIRNAEDSEKALSHWPFLHELFTMQLIKANS